MNKSELAREYRDKYGMEMPTLKLARIMYAEHNLLFNSVESARTTLRAIEGKAGKANGILVTHKTEERPRNPYNLPKSDESEWQPFILSGAKKAGLLCDVHLPYHSIAATTAAIDHFISFGIDTLILNGDVLDFYSLSRFCKDPRKRHFAEELEAFEQFINSLNEALNCRIILKWGNHEERYDQFLMMKAKELVGVPEMNLDQLLFNRAPNVEIVKDKRIIQANALDIIHGHEFAMGFFSPVNVARGLQLRAKTNAAQAHNHVTSEHTEPNLRGESKTTWSIGCACELHPEYMPINKWNHGFATLELSDNTDEFKLLNYRVINGRTL